MTSPTTQLRSATDILTEAKLYAKSIVLPLSYSLQYGDGKVAREVYAKDVIQDEVTSFAGQPTDIPSCVTPEHIGLTKVPLKVCVGSTKNSWVHIGRWQSKVCAGHTYLISSHQLLTSVCWEQKFWRTQ
jgi:hypothetical protein